MTSKTTTTELNRAARTATDSPSWAHLVGRVSLGHKLRLRAGATDGERSAMALLREALATR